MKADILILGFFPSIETVLEIHAQRYFYKENHTWIFLCVMTYDTLKKQTKADGLWQGRIIQMEHGGLKNLDLSHQFCVT